MAARQGGFAGGGEGGVFAGLEDQFLDALAQGFIRPVAVEGRAGPVPVDHLPVPVETLHGDVVHRFEDAPEAALALVQGRFRFAAAQGLGVEPGGVVGSLLALFLLGEQDQDDADAERQGRSEQVAVGGQVRLEARVRGIHDMQAVEDEQPAGQSGQPVIVPPGAAPEQAADFDQDAAGEEDEGQGTGDEAQVELFAQHGPGHRQAG